MNEIGIDNKTYFKDNVFGYIKIKKEIVRNIINSTIFQRLREIEQSNLSILYPSSKTTRFSHSIGVYYLAMFASSSLKNNFENFKDDKSKNIYFKDTVTETCRNFEIAALLHDIGHAPFSHLSEGYFWGNKCEIEETYDLEKKLFEIYEMKIPTKFSAFKSDYLSLIENDRPKPHEISGCIVILQDDDLYDYMIEKNYDYDLIIRCIIGCTYSIKKDYKKTKYIEKEIKKSIKNGLIRLLNSNTIDVDKLDYLLRDSVMSGFESSQIDYRRILSSAILYYNDVDYYKLAFNKRGVSVLDNIHNALRNQQMWLFNHPSVVYDNFLKNYNMILLSDYLSSIKTKTTTVTKEELLCQVEYGELFSIQSIVGVNKINSDLTVQNLCDYDIMFLLKQHKEAIINKYGKDFINQLFNRKIRYKPLWKSYFDVEVYLSKEVRKFKYLTFFTQLKAYNDYYRRTKKIEVIQDAYCPKGAIEFFDFMKDLCSYFSVNITDIIVQGTFDVMKRENEFINNELNIYFQYKNTSKITQFKDLMRREVRNQRNQVEENEVEFNDSDLSQVSPQNLQFYVYKNNSIKSTEDLTIITFFDFVSKHKLYSLND